MFSRRLDFAAEENALSRLLDQRRGAGAAILDLTSANPTTLDLPYPAAAIQTALADPRSLVYQPAPRGLDEARAAIVAYYSARGQPTKIERLLLTASTSEAYAWLFKLLADPGDEVLVPQPSYPLFDFLAALESVRLRPYRLEYDGRWQIDLASLAAAITPRSRAIIIVNPNHPTGSYLKRRELDRLCELAAAHDLALISDEVFADYPLDDDDGTRVPSLVDCRTLSFALSGLSKVVGLPQLKLGWIHIGGPTPLAAAAAARLELIADTYLSVGAPVQHAAARLLALRTQVGGAIHARLRESLAIVRAATTAGAVSPLHVEGGWQVILRLPHTRSDETWAIELLRDQSLHVQPGYFFDLDAHDRAYLVISLLTPPARLREGMARLVAHVAASG